MTILDFAEQSRLKVNRANVGSRLSELGNITGARIRPPSCHIHAGRAQRTAREVVRTQVSSGDPYNDLGVHISDIDGFGSWQPPGLHTCHFRADLARNRCFPLSQAWLIGYFVGKAPLDHFTEKA